MVESLATAPADISLPPGENEAAAIRSDYSRAMSGLRAYVSMGLRLIDVKARLPHGKYLPWCEKHLDGLSPRHLQRAKLIATGLCESVGIKCDTRVVFENLPAEILQIIDGASGIRALLGGVQNYRHDADEARAKETCELYFAKDPALRDEWEPRVIGGEMTWCEAVCGIAGHVATAGKRRAEPNYKALMPQSIITLRNSFTKWETLPPETRAHAVTEFRQLANVMPPELKTALGLS